MGLEKIMELKKEMGLTNEELANLSGIPKGTLDKILSGVTKDPKLNTLKALAKVLKCTLDDFDDVEGSNEKRYVTKNQINLLSHYNKLNDIGKIEAEKRVEELTQINKYVVYSDMVAEPKEEYNVEAAHSDGLTNDEISEMDRKIAEFEKNNK